MANLDELIKWCEQARKLLSLLDSDRSAMADNAPVVKKLIEVMQKTPGEYPGLAGWIQEFNTYAESARVAREQVKARRLKEELGKARVKEASRQLLALRHELELAIAEKDPRATPEVRKQVLDSARHKPVYLDKQGRIGEAITELRALPGTATQVAALQKLLDDAEALEPNYQAAYDQLAGLTKNLADGRKAAEAFANGLGNPAFKTAMDESLQAIDVLDTKIGQGEPGVVQALRQRRAKVLMDIDATPQTQRQSAITTGIGTLNTIRDEARRAIEVAERAREAMARERSTIIRRLGELKACAPVSVVQPWLQQVGTAETLGTLQQYEKSLEAFKALKVEFNRVYELHANAQGRWNVVDQELTPLIEGIKPLLETKLALQYPALVGVAGPLNTAVITELRAGLVRENRFVDAVAMEEERAIRSRLRQVLDALDKLEAGETPDLDFKDRDINQRVALGQLDAQVNAAVTRTNEAIALLEKEKGDVKLARQAVRDQQELWRKAREPFYKVDGQTATDEEHYQALEDRDKVLTQLEGSVASVVKALDDVADGVRTTLGDSGQLLASQDQKKANDAYAAFKQQSDAASRGLDYIAGFGLAPSDTLLTQPPALAGLGLQLETLLDQARQGAADEIGLRTLIEQIEAKRKQVETAMTLASQNALRDGEQLGNDLTTLRNADKGDKARAAFHDKQADRLSDLLAMVRSTVPAVAQEGVRLLALFKTEVQAFALEAGKKTGGVNYAAVDTAMKALKAELERKDFKTWLPTKQGPLQGEFNELLPTKLGGLSPAEALALVAELRGRVDLAVQEALGLLGKQADLTKKLNEVRQALEASPVKKGQPKVHADLKARLKALEDAPEYDIVLTLASLDALGMLIDGAADPTRAQKMADKLDADAFQAEKDKLAFEAESDVFQKNDLRRITQLKDSFKPDSARFNTSLFDTAKSHHEAALKDAKAGNYAGARERLRLARATVTALVQQPLAPLAASKEALLNSQVNWRNAVREHVASLERVEKAMVAAWTGDTSVDDEAKKSALGMIGPSKSLFNALQFNAAVLNFNQPETPESLSKRPELKEQALAALRQSERVIAENSVLAALRTNPFSPFSTAGIAAALRDMKGALLAS